MIRDAGLKALRLLDPERAHGLALKTLAAGLAGRDDAPDPPVLKADVFGRAFSNPIGIAAGFDKHCEALAATLALGPGFTEIGGVAPLPQYGNPKPRLFRLTEDRAVINRFGFNSQGHAVVAARLRAAREAGVDGIVGVNLAINKDTPDPAEDYAAGIKAFGRDADFVTINISSPNTKGLRDLQAENALAAILERASQALAEEPVATRPILLVKTAPDLDDVAIGVIADVALSFQAHGLGGLIVSNTTVARPDGLKSRFATEAGGLSGRPLFGPSTAVLKAFAGRINGRMPLIGAGGVASGQDAFAKLEAGASLVQLYSALVYEGPGLIGRIKRELAALLEQAGARSPADIVGRG